MFACEVGHLDTVITLLEYGANSHVRNRVSMYIHVYTIVVSICLFLIQGGMTASDVASLNEYSDICEVLQLMGSPQTDTSNDIYEVSTL